MKDENRAHPYAIRRKAVKLLGMGHSATTIATELGVSADSVRRWAKVAKVKKGSLAGVALKQAEEKLEIEDDERLPVVRQLKKAERQEEFREQLAATSSPAEQYRAMIIANGVKMLDAAFKAPPIVKNMRDLKTLTEIVGESLGVSGRKGGSNRLSIDLNVLTGNKPVTVEAEIIDKKD